MEVKGVREGGRNAKERRRESRITKTKKGLLTAPGAGLGKE